ncbi:Immunoglobulin I-set domain containing protein 8, partial [Sarcoptes scabiei]
SPHVDIFLNENNQDFILENSSIRLECLVEANPSPHEAIDWFFNNSPIKPTDSRFSLIGANYLAIEKLRFDQHDGYYHCSASNFLGRNRSEDFRLKVFCKLLNPPKCLDPSLSFEISFNQTIQIQCNVDAKPPLINFEWLFNGHIINKFQFTQRGMQSILKFSPKIRFDSGEIICQARNLVGEMSQPCHYNINLREIPDPIRYCKFASTQPSSTQLFESYETTVNSFSIEHATTLTDSSSSVWLECYFGWNGGLETDCSLVICFDDDGVEKNCLDRIISDTHKSNRFDRCLFDALNLEKYHQKKLRLLINSFNSKGSSSRSYELIFTKNSSQDTDSDNKNVEDGTNLLVLNQLSSPNENESYFDGQETEKFADSFLIRIIKKGLPFSILEDRVFYIKSHS